MLLWCTFQGRKMDCIELDVLYYMQLSSYFRKTSIFAGNSNVEEQWTFGPFCNQVIQEPQWTKHKNKNAFQWDAYRLLRWPPLDVSIRGYDVTSCLLPCSLQGVWCPVVSGPLYLPGGVYPREGGLLPEVEVMSERNFHYTPSPVNRLTDAFKNVTFPCGR